MSMAISIIKDEHRCLAAVLEGLRYLVGEIREGRMRTDFPLLWAMLRYIEAFPDKLHTLKEDEYLFRALRQRRPEAAALLAELEAEHVRGHELTDALKKALAGYEQQGGAGLDPFVHALDAHADFHWAHMRKEEDVVLPMAEQALTADDWTAIDAALGSNDDPLVGVKPTREFRELFRRIVNLAPPPIGLGPAQSPDD